MSISFNAKPTDLLPTIELSVAYSIDDLTFTVGKTKLNVSCLNNEKTAMFTSKINVENLTYDKPVDAEETAFFSVQSRRLAEILKRLQKDKSYSFNADKNRLIITLDKQKFTVVLIDVEPTEIPTLSASPSTILNIESALLKSAFDNASLYSNHCLFTVDKKGSPFTLSAEDKIKGEFSSELEIKTFEELHKLKVGVAISIIYPVVKYIKTGLTLKLENDKPIIVEAEGIKLILAPRILDEESD